MDRFRYLQLRVLIMTMIGYTLFYFLRKNLSFAMPGLQQDYGITKTSFGFFLTLHGVVYGGAKYLNGVVGDQCNSRKFLCLGLFLCLLVNVAFGFGPVLVALLVGSSSSEAFVTVLVVVLGVLWVANGLFQSMGFAPCAKLIAFWVPPQKLASMMGLWNTSHSVGAGLVTIMCGYIMGLGALGSQGVGVGMWRWCFWIPAILAVVGLVALWFLTPDTPSEEGFPESVENDGSVDIRETRGAVSAKELIYRNPAIWCLGFCNLTINLVRFAILDWGPILLKESKGISLVGAGWMVAMFEIAGVLGMVFAGFATDRLANGRGPRVCAFMMFGAAVFMAAFWLLPQRTPLFVLLALLACGGFCVYGPYAVTGTTATNLATKNLAGTAVGFIGLFAYLSVIFTGVGMGTLADHFGGWSVPFACVIVVALIGVALFAALWNTRANSYEKFV